MIDKLCVCGHAMEDRGAQTLEMNGSSLGSNLWTDHVEVDVYICPWCGRMAFFEPEDVREKRFRDACEEMTSVTRRSRSKKRRKGVQSAKNSFRAFSARTTATTSRRRTARRSFDEFIVKVRTLCALFA